MNSFRSYLIAFAVCMAAAAPRSQPDPSAKVAAARASLVAWLESDHGDVALLERAVAAILAGGTEALVDVGTRARAAHAKSDGQAGRGLDAIITHVAIGYLKRETSSGIVFQGQYEQLRALQPFVGTLFLNLLLDTPDWFSAQERHLLVPPLRDVYPESPGKDMCDRLRAVAIDEDLEPESLRLNLAFALAQWGDRSLIDARIAQVTKDAESPKVSAEHRAALRYELADIHCHLREYARAAQIHVDMLRQAESAGTELKPVYYYNAACCLARAGAGQAALDELQRAVDLMQSGRIDASARLERKLFERDPDLASVRDSDRFRAIVRAAFGDEDSSKGAVEPGKGKDDTGKKKAAPESKESERKDG